MSPNYNDNHIEFTLTPSCPVMCTYCPQTAYIKAYKKLENSQNKKFTSFEDFKIMLDNVEHLVKDVYFTGYTEPMLNKNWYEIAKYSIDSGYTTHFNTTLVGATSESIKKMVELNMEIRVHLTDSEVLVKENLYKELVDYHRAIRGYDPTFDAFTDKGAQIKIGSDAQILYHRAQSRGGSVEDSWVTRVNYKGPVGCSTYRQYSNVILPNGDVSVCCQDFGLENILGNLLKNTLREIHSSKEMQDFNTRMVSYDDNVCKRCTYAFPLE